MLKIIPGFPAYYATEDGRIWSQKTRRFLKPCPLHDGYIRVALCKDLKVHYKRVHRLVLETFIGPCPEGMECCHENDVRADNRLKNLRWDTRENNQRDSIKHGTHRCLHQNGRTNPNTKLKEKDVRMIVYMFRTGLFSQKEIAKVYNMGRSSISDIITKKHWKHIWTG